MRPFDPQTAKRAIDTPTAQNKKQSKRIKNKAVLLKQKKKNASGDLFVNGDEDFGGYVFDVGDNGNYGNNKNDDDDDLFGTKIVKIILLQMLLMLTANIHTKKLLLLLE
mmetsp:Transcript_44029/g.66342  ORF Transcript_44029/g.66342 Transcript_44029/m.66342 type:complete len:109 (-) Transcript_44029:1463-1789(-)